MKDGLSFSDALIELKKGSQLTRAGWNGKGMYIELQTPDEHSKMGLPYLFIKTVDELLVPWFASQMDLLANDWSVVGAQAPKNVS